MGNISSGRKTKRVMNNQMILIYYSRNLFTRTTFVLARFVYTCVYTCWWAQESHSPARFCLGQSGQVGEREQTLRARTGSVKKMCIRIGLACNVFFMTKNHATSRVR